MQRDVIQSDTSAAARQRRALIIVGVFLLVLAIVTWVDALRMGTMASVGVGPSVSMKLIGSLLGVLGLAHLVAALRHRPATTPIEDEPVLNRQALAWVLGGLMAMIAILAMDGGFIIGAAIVFATTARAFGKPLLSASPLYGLILSSLVYVFFTKALSLSLPTGVLERLLFA